MLTAKLIPVRTTSYLQNRKVTLVAFLWREVRFAETKTNADLSAATTVEAGECRESVRMGALLDEFTTYQVEGSIVDYLALDG